MICVACNPVICLSSHDTVEPLTPRSATRRGEAPRSSSSRPGSVAQSRPTESRLVVGKQSFSPTHPWPTNTTPRRTVASGRTEGDLHTVCQYALIADVCYHSRAGRTLFVASAAAALPDPTSQTSVTHLTPPSKSGMKLLARRERHRLHGSYSHDNSSTTRTPVATAHDVSPALLRIVQAVLTRVELFSTALT
jgi:hypothetical protein